MSRISMDDYQKNASDSGVQTFTLLSDAVQRYGKKKTAGVPKKIEVHMPTAEEAQLKADNKYLKCVVEAVGKMLGV